MAIIIPDSQKSNILSRNSTGNSYWQVQAISNSLGKNMLGLLIEKEGIGEYLHRLTPFSQQKEDSCPQKRVELKYEVEWLN